MKNKTKEYTQMKNTTKIMVAQCGQEDIMKSEAFNPERLTWYHSGYPDKTVAQDPERCRLYD